LLARILDMPAAAVWTETGAEDESRVGVALPGHRKPSVTISLGVVLEPLPVAAKILPGVRERRHA
jgi:hypothetical protein